MPESQQQTKALDPVEWSILGQPVPTGLLRLCTAIVLERQAGLACSDRLLSPQSQWLSTFLIQFNL